MLLTVEHPADPNPAVAAPRLAVVLWNGNVGGAESVKAMIAREWRKVRRRGIGRLRHRRRRR